MDIKDNLDIIDEHNMQDVWMHEGLVYSGDTALINDQIHKDHRIPSLLGAAVLGLNNTATPSTTRTKFIWTDIDAQENNLNQKPTCYLIIGKPEVGDYHLGEAIAKKYNCIHFCPKNIVQDEILQGSLTGRCVDFNMKHNIPCTYSYIFDMLKQKLKSPAVHHRGYVISGFPMTTAYRNPFCMIKSMYSEESFYTAEEILNDIIYNLRRKKTKHPRQDDLGANNNIDSEEEEEYIEEEEEEEKKEELSEEDAEEQEVAAELPKFVLNSCSNVVFYVKPYYDTRQSISIEQLHEVFNVDLRPDIIIHITCPDADVITKKLHRFLSIKTGLWTVEPYNSKTETAVRWPAQYNISDYENPHVNYVFHPKYNVRTPINFKDEMINQLCNYRHYSLPYIEKKLMDYDPKQVIKLDGRTSTYQMMHQVSERLLLMHISPVLIPEPLYLIDPPEDFEEFWSSVAESQVIRGDDLSFKRCPSPWYNRCPVELKKRQSVIGKPKYAVAMFKHVYLMSSLPNFISFCRNPRPYLYLEYLEPTCRIIVTGTKSSGKTMISECLSWLFDTRVTSFNALLDNEKQKKYQVYAKTILSEIVPVIEDTRLLKWQQKEQHREASLKAWNQSMLKLLKKYPPLLTESLKYVVKESHEGIESEKKQIIHEVPEPDPVFLKKFNSLRERLSFLPILDSVDDCRTAIASGNLTQYAPFELANVTEKPSLPLLGDEDVTKAISEYITVNDLHKEIEPTTEEVMNEIIKLLSNVDIEQQVQTGFQEQYGKFIIDGFPSDPEYWDMLINAKLTPDYTISIMENREIDPNLLLHYLNIDKHIKNHHDILSLAHDPLILCKLQTKKIPIARDLDIKMVVHDIVYDSVSKVVDSKTEDKPEISTEMVAAFTESIEKFREDWDNIKLKLEDKMKCFIEIELENKTDVEVLDEALLKLRQCYYLPAETNEDEDVEEVDEAESAKPKDLLTYNDTQNLCETSIYCPYTYYKYGLLWEGKRDISLKYDNKVHYFAKEEFLELFRKDVTKYQAYNHPFKKLPALKICVVGCAGSGLSALSKRLAVELGLIHIHFADIINYYYMPRHYKNVGRKYENPFTDEPMEEEAVVEFQMDEENPNLLTDIFSNEKELRRIVYNYYERGQPILPVIMQKIITNLWFTEPFKSTGFVLDGYPRLPQDVEDLIHCNCIPDIVIEIESNAEIGVARIGPLMFNLWKSQYKEAKAAHKIVIETQQNLWMSYIVKKTVIKLILEELLENCVGVEYPLKKESLAVESFVFDAHPTGSTNVDPKLFQIYNELIEQYPKPTDTREWEKPDDVRERIDSRIEAICETEYDNIQTFKELLTDNKINVVTIDGSKPFIKVLRRTISHLKHLRNRSQSFFEQTYIITSDIAELLLAQGYYFLSNFGRLCPVYVYENEQIIHNSYKIGRRLGNIFPIIHRSYIYFVCSKDNVIKFRKNPLKYIIGETINAFRPHPLGIAIIGAPKSGKSTLAAKLARRHNLLCISKGMAIRSVLENMPWTELGSRIFKNLHNGDIIDTNSVMNAIQTVSIDHRAVTYGFVLDGFPTVPYEAMLLAEIGLYPNLIFDITADKVRILENSQNEVHYDILKYVPPYSHTYIENKYTKWNEQAYKIRNWIRSDYQNIHSLDGHRSRWQCYQYVKKIILELTSEIHSYLTKVGTEVVPVKVMAISNVLFEKKMSVYKNLCPVCLRKNILKHSGYPVDKNGVMQYRNTFYWICEKHVDLVKKFPDYYLDDDLDIPELPAVVSIINPHNVYENGICIVTYAENLPAQLLQRGTHQFAAAYKSKTYLFCSELCHRKFLEKPMFYADITVFKESSSYPRLSLKKLPDLGYLEQTLGNILTEACCSVNAIRPKYPGLSVELSALLHIALYLKTHNERLPKDQIKFYRKALSMYENRSKLILDLGLRMRSMENPFISYPKCRHGTPKQSNPPDKSPSIKTSSIDSAQSMGEPSMRSDVSSSTGIKRSSVAAYQGGDDDDISKYYALLGPSSSNNVSSRVPVPDDRYDYLCEFHKPASKVPAFLNVVDIAGLVRGAAEGQGLGNAFLSHIKACDAIFNLCRAFDDEDVIHVDGDVNPVRDLETIGEELRLKDEEELMKNIEKLDRVVNRGNDKKLKPEYDTLQKVKTVLVDEKKHIRFGDWSAADIEVLNKYLFLTSKPALYLVNLSEKDYIRKKNKWLPKLKEWIDKNDPGSPLIPFSGALETKLVEMDAAERQAFLKENNLTSALDKIIVQGYKALQLEYFFTAGPDEVKAWTIQKGTKAPQAAGRIHTDFEKGFIMAEVMHFKDFKEEGTEAACKAAGKYRQQGRNYVVEDGDIIFFKFNAGAGLKDAKKK